MINVRIKYLDSFIVHIQTKDYVYFIVLLLFIRTFFFSITGRDLRDFRKTQGQCLRRS